MPTEIAFMLNGQPVRVEADGDRKLLWVLRTELGLTGTKFGCGHGQCRSCTVLVNDQAVPACMLSASSVSGKQVTTIEGLEKDGQLHPLQKAFMANDALQCGFCTPGMILTAYGLLHSNPDLSREDIVNAMDGNLCRCGAHKRIITAIQAAGQEMQESGGPSV
jgi:aerobic-type carbon monoxide dehydrogenase small subunit (CoxS/CutS family)